MENMRAEITRPISGNVGANNALLIHPLPMRTVFRDCFLANFAVSPEALERLSFKCSSIHSA